MSDNSAFPFGLDFYEGNSVRSWSKLQTWNKTPRFAYFRLGIGLHKDDLALLDDAIKETDWQVGGYYELWTPEVPRADMIKTLEDQLSNLPIDLPNELRFHLPLAIAFEEQTHEDKNGRKITAWPSVGDLKNMIATFTIKGFQCLVYTSLSGLEAIRASGVIEFNDYKWWIARYNFHQGLEGEVDITETLDLLKKVYSLNPENILFIQTADELPYPEGASYDLGADYNRAVSYKFEHDPVSPVQEPPVQVPPVTEPEYKIGEVIPDGGLLIREKPGMDYPIIGGLVKGSSVAFDGITLDGKWAHLAGYVDMDFLKIHDISFPVSPAEPEQSSGDPIFYRALHDFEMSPDYLPRMLQRGSGLPSDRGVPETINLENSLPVILDEETQRFIYEVLKYFAPGFSPNEYARAFTALLGTGEAFANGTGFDQDKPRANFVTGEDVKGELPKLDRSRVTGGALVQILDEKPVQVGGEPCLKVRTLIAGQYPKMADLKMGEYFFATTCTPFLLQERYPMSLYRCNPFPQLDGHDIALPLITREGYGYIQAKRLVKMTEPIPSDYLPYIR